MTHFHGWLVDWFKVKFQSFSCALSLLHPIIRNQETTFKPVDSKTENENHIYYFKANNNNINNNNNNNSNSNKNNNNYRRSREIT